MHRRFLAAIDAAVDGALPAGWPRLPPHGRPAPGRDRARPAFRLAHDPGPRPYLVVIAVPPFAARTAAVEGDLVALVDHVLGRGGTVLLFYEHESDPNGWVREHLDFPHPRFLCLPCFAPEGAPEEPPDRCSAGAGTKRLQGRRGGGRRGQRGRRGRRGRRRLHLPRPTQDGPEPLSGVIRDLWSGHLSYDGPWEGVQTVGVEIMKDHCWRCRFSLDVVTGIVFPDRGVADWSRCDWIYYQSLLQLARIPDPIIPTLSAAVEAWRAAGDRRLTAIRWRYSKTVGYAYWAAECTACRALQGDFPMMEERLELLDDLDSRRTGILSYRPLRLDVPRQALQELTWSAEVNPHARFLGWYRTGDPELEGSTAIEGLRAVTVLSFPDGAESHPHLPGDAGPDRAAGIPDLAEERGPDLPPGTATPPPAPTAEITGSADLGLPGTPAAAAALSGHGPLHRLGEILAAWLGWLGASRLPPEATGTETETPAAASAALAETSPRPVAPTALSRNHP